MSFPLYCLVSLPTLLALFSNRTSQNIDKYAKQLTIYQFSQTMEEWCFFLQYFGKIPGQVLIGSAWLSLGHFLSPGPITLAQGMLCSWPECVTCHHWERMITFSHSSAGKDWLLILGETEVGQAKTDVHFTKNYRRKSNIKFILSHCHLKTYHSIYLNKLKTYIHTKTSKWMFIAALVIIAKTWKQPGHPVVGEWINKLWCVQTMEDYSGLKRKELSSHVKM